MFTSSNIHRIVFGGDILPSCNNISLFERGDVNTLFGEKIVDLFQKADFSFFNLEGPLTSSSNKQSKTGPVLKAPEKCIAGIKNLGVDAVMLANNHITDYQTEGLADTIRVLDENGIKYIGVGDNLDNIGKSISIPIGERHVCIYNVSEFFYNSATTTSPGANLYDEYVVCNDIKELKQSHDYVIVIYHGGAEEFPYPTPLLRQHFHRMVDCGADFISAQHTHCIGCHEKYKGAYLLYGQGNFLFARMKNDITREGLLTELIFNENNVEVKQHKVRVSSSDTLQYDEQQDLSLFIKRSDELYDSEFIRKKYQEFCYNQAIIKNRFLSSFQGNTICSRLLKKLPYKFYQKYVLENYSEEQLMRVAKCLESERYAENMCACIHQMMGK